MKCPNCSGPVTLEPHTHPAHTETTIYRCQGKGSNPCKQWGTIVPDGVSPGANLEAEAVKQAGYVADQAKAAAKKSPAPAPKKKAKKKKPAKKVKAPVVPTGV